MNPTTLREIKLSMCTQIQTHIWPSFSNCTFIEEKGSVGVHNEVVVSIGSSDHPNGIFGILQDNSTAVMGEETEENGPPTQGVVTFARDKGSFYHAKVRNNDERCW